MNEDLSDVGLSALEALEAQDEQETSVVDESQEETAEGGEPAETEANEGETNETSPDDGEDGGETASSDTTEDSEDTEEKDVEAEEKEETKTEKKAELTDAEFEEMAKKRGYSKAKTAEETAKENEQKALIDRLNRRPKEIEEDNWNDMSEKNRVVYNALPYLTIRGKDGNVLNVKVPAQIPEDFEFESERAKAQFYTNLQAQENRATQITQALDNREARARQAAERQKEAIDIVSQIESLQKSGDLPTPKAKNGDKDFNSDPAVVLIDKVLGYRAERLKGGDRLSIRDSYLLYKAEHPEDFKQKEAKGDAERRNVAKKVAGGSKGAGTATNSKEGYKTQYYKRGMSTEDVLDRILDDME